MGLFYGATESELKTGVEALKIPDPHKEEFFIVIRGIDKHRK